MIIRTRNEDYYNLELLPPGIAGTLSGLSHDNWRQRDALLSLDKDKNNNGSYRTRAITVEEARQIRGVLQDIREGKRAVSESILTTDDNLTAYERQHPPKEVDKEFSNQVISFLEPRIEVAAENLDEMAKVPLGLVDDRLGEKREIDRPPML